MGFPLPARHGADVFLIHAHGKKLVLINDIRFKGKRLQARRKAADVMIELIHSARCAGITSSFFSAFPNICRRLWNGKK